MRVSVVATLDHKWPLLRQENQSWFFFCRDALAYLLTDRVLDKDHFTGRGTPHFTCKVCLLNDPSFSTWHAVSRRWWLKERSTACCNWTRRAAGTTLCVKQFCLHYTCALGGGVCTGAGGPGRRGRGLS